jgi:dihydrofolate reductase
MGTVGTGFSMSLDGFVARPDGEVGPLFDWYSEGETPFEVTIGADRMRVSADAGEILQQASQATGALVTGRKLFDQTHGWGGKHPLDVPIVVVTHRIPQGWEKPPFTFVTDGVPAAIARAKQIAGEQSVAIASASIVQQCLNAGLLDEIHIDLIPMLLGQGIRLFDQLNAEHRLECIDVKPMRNVTHLTYRVVQ